VSIDAWTPGPIPVDHLIKEGTIRKAPTREAWLDFSATRSRSTFQGARIEATNLGENRFEITTTHADTFSLWLHPKMVDFSRPVSITTDGVTTEHRIEPSLLTALHAFERKEDWGLIYHARVRIKLNK